MAAGAGTVFKLGAAASATAPAVDEPFFADRTALRRQFHRAAPTFAAGDALHREVAARMVERLGYVKLTPARTLDLGCATGAAGAALRTLYPKTAITGVDFAPGMAQQAAAQPDGWLARLRGAQRHAVCADLSALPLAQASHGLVFSNLALHWLDDPAAALREAHRVLELGGLLMFSMLGPDTLCELRDAWAEAEAGERDAGAAIQSMPEVRPGTAAENLAELRVDSAKPAAPLARWHVKRFIDLHDIGDLLVKTGFATPVMDMEKIVLTYQKVEQIVADLRATGSVNAMQGRARGLTGKRVWQRAAAAYEKRRSSGRLPATFEVVYGHAWKAPARKTAGGDDVVRFVGRDSSQRR